MPAYNFIKLTGKRFGRLLVVERVENNRWKQSCWLCQCDCNNTLVVRGYSLRQGKTKSCGCFKRDSTRIRQTLPVGQAAFNALYRSYRREAENRSLSFELTKEDFSFLTKMNCYYCGIKPNQIMSPSATHNGDYLYNGIDRIDNDKGYTTDNVVSSCGVCNRMKNNLTVQDFLGHVEKIYKRRN